ncbi:hypothetical protein WA026_021636 [Henosepilachna vigintioctopunctata]|uniref:Endonuclease/exonuclease/phosphatase domain-containing protein n=1 Tax=Henosepilachna vigintioctopunctata TaxID=420089 RepID=A0AAW1V3F5_9CUCU
MMIVAEPNKKLAKAGGWMLDLGEDAAVWIINKSVDMGRIIVFSVYVSPNVSLECFRSFVEELFGEVAKCTSRTIVAGDINAKSSMWGAPRTDEREYWLRTG